MRKVVSISLDQNLAKMLMQGAERENTSKSEIIQKALRQYLHLNEANYLRTKLKKYADKAGFLSEEDIYQDIS